MGSYPLMPLMIVENLDYVFCITDIDMSAAIHIWDEIPVLINKIRQPGLGRTKWARSTASIEKR